MFSTVCSFEAVDEFFVGENRKFFGQQQFPYYRTVPPSTKRNINLTSVEFLRPQAGSYDKRYWTRVFQLAGRFKTSQGEVCRGHGTSNYSAIPLTDVLLEAVYFPAGEEMLKAKRSCHKYLKQK